MGTIDDGRKAYDLRRGRTAQDTEGGEVSSTTQKRLDAGRAEWVKRHPKRAGQGEQR